jgi:hypothetical protein
MALQNAYSVQESAASWHVKNALKGTGSAIFGAVCNMLDAYRSRVLNELARRQVKSVDAFPGSWD